LLPHGNTFMATQADGRPLEPRSITHAWGRLSKTKDLPRVRLHDLRHAHAAHLLTRVHPKVAPERLGHSKVGIALDLYSHVMPGMQEEAAAPVVAALRRMAWG